MKYAKRALSNLNIKPSKNRGQNFLIDPTVLDTIISFGAPTSGEHLIEIGPGLGATEMLHPIAQKSAHPLSVIELEDVFCRELAHNFTDITIVNNDVREVDFAQFGSDLTVFGNLPYSYSTDIIFHLIDNRAFLKRGVFLLQKEFSERVGAEPGGREYGILSIMAQLWCDVALGATIPGTAFHPPTKVDSRLVALTFLKQPKVPVEDHLLFSKIVRGAFCQRRKKIKNSLRASGIASGELVDRYLEKCDIDGNRRAETLSIEEFAKLTVVWSQ